MWAASSSHAIAGRQGYERLGRDQCSLGNSLKITGRVGSNDLRQPFDAVLLVLLDSDFNAFAKYEASRTKVEAALTLPGSKARNERGALAIRHSCR